MRYLKLAYFVSTAVGLTAISHFYLIFCRIYKFFVSSFDLASRAHFVAQFWGRSMFYMMPGWRITVKGKENLPSDNDAVVYVANHQSNADIWAVYFLGTRFSWLSKAEVFKIPMVGSSMRWARYISIERGNKSSHKQAMAQSLKCLEDGISMFFFPEGTRSKDKKIKDFKAGAFHLAEEAGVDIQPLVLHGTGDLLVKGSMVPSNQAHVQLHILPRMKKLENEELDVFIKRVRDVIVKRYETLQSPSLEAQPQVSYSSS